MQDSILLERLKKLLAHKKSKNFYAQRLGVSVAKIERLLEMLRGQEEESSTGFTSHSKSTNEDGDVKSEIVIDFEPKTVDELYELHKIDRERYKITNYWSKLKSTGKFTSSVFATLKKPHQYTAEDFASFLKTYSPKPVQITVKKALKSAQTVDIELSIADYHLAKRTMDNDTLEDRKKKFFDIASNLVTEAASCYNIRTIVFVISNDFFHTDTYYNTTTNGTPQDIIAEFDHEYEAGFDLLASTITMLRQFSSDVRVILVQGNHDRTKSFYLAHALEVFFSRDKGIKFDRANTTTKYVVLGETFIGYHHGNCKIEDLPLLFMTGDSAVAFGNAKYREVHTGDKHHYMAKEVKGVRIQQLPSLSGVDRYHRDHNYVNQIRSAILFAYHPSKGKKAEFEERL